MRMIRQNDNVITGEVWKCVPNTEYAFTSNKGRYGYRYVMNNHSALYLCTENELRSRVNFFENTDNIFAEAEGYTNVNYYDKWMSNEENYASDAMRD